MKKILITAALVLYAGSVFALGGFQEDYVEETHPVGGDVMVFEYADGSGTRFLKFENFVANYLDTIYYTQSEVDALIPADVTLNASATTGGLSILGQEISNRAATNAQTGYATAAQITAQEANTTAIAGLGTASTREAEDTLTDGANLPDGAAVKAYGDANWSTGSGDVVGPASATDNAISRYSTTTGKLIQGSGVIIDDSNNVTGVAALSAASITITPSALPTMTFKDSDLLGADEEAAKLFANATTVTDGAEVTDVTLTYMDAGTVTDAFIIDGSDNQLEIAIDTTLQAGDIVGSEIATIAVDQFFPIGWAEDGTTAPADIAAITGTTRNKGRAFDGAANEDVTFIWQVDKDFSGSAVTVHVHGIVSASTAPANTETVAFSAALSCWANSELSTIAVGTAQTASLTADATYVQYDGLMTAVSSAITPAGSIAAGETCAIALIRLATTTDTYAQDFDVTGITVNYSKQLAN